MPALSARQLRLPPGKHTLSRQLYAAQSDCSDTKPQALAAADEQRAAALPASCWPSFAFPKDDMEGVDLQVHVLSSSMADRTCSANMQLTQLVTISNGVA